MLLLRIIFYILALVLGTLIGYKLATFILIIRFAEVITTRLTIVLVCLMFAIGWAMSLMTIVILF